MVQEYPGVFSIDTITPYGVALTAFYERSYAYYTTTDRWPVILQHLISRLEAEANEEPTKHGEVARNELHAAVDKLDALITRIKTNQKIEQISTQAPDTELWNRAIAEMDAKDGHSCYYNTTWLFSECYLYRRIQEILEETTQLKTYDPFFSQKVLAFNCSIGAIIALGTLLTEMLAEQTVDAETLEMSFVKMLKLNLWSNKCDLSLSLGVTDTKPYDPLSLLEEFEDFLLVDHSSSIWKALNVKTPGDIVAIVHDNAGYELFTDFCVADFIITNNLSKTIRFYVKAIPWFISDVTIPDFEWMLESLCNSDQNVLVKLGTKWRQFLLNKQWVVIGRQYFWTSPYEFCKMEQIDPWLYLQLAEAKLVMFKGDLNYRKLLGDLNWEPTTLFSKALQGFCPSNVCTLRTIKADLICGLRKGVAQRLIARDPQWLITGDYAVIQYCGRP